MNNKIKTLFLGSLCSSAHEHTFIGKGTYVLRILLFVIMMVMGVNGAWGAFTEGLYYIKSNVDATFYLCPSIGCYYGNNVDQPHLTTFKTGDDQYSIWKIVPVEGETDTYYIIHYKTGRYLKSNENIKSSDGKSNRKAVHLEVKPETLTDDFKFLIKNSSSPYQIYPRIYYTSAVDLSFNPTSGNKECYAPANADAQGMIGLYSKGDNGSKWKILSVSSALTPCATPIIKYDGDNIIISYPYSDETGITIYYTTDGTDPSTSGTRSTYSSPISASNVIKVRAIATKTDFVNSDEAVLWGSARPFLIQSKECEDYYLVPAVNGTNINTSSLSGMSMQWTLQNAGTSTGGVQYYYVVNSNSKKINFNTTYNYLLTLNDASADANKFCVIENGYNTGGFFLIPVSQPDRVLYKNNGNVNTDNCKSEQNKQWNTNLDLWSFRACNETADQKGLFSPAPFSVSDDNETHFYRIASVGAAGYYIVPPTDPDGYATTSNKSEDYTNNPWLFKVAASDNWLTYYYIINAATGKYMYFNKANNLTAEQTDVISMMDVSEKNAENEEKFQFIMVRSTTTDACYIVPKGYSYADESHKNFNDNKYFGLWYDDKNPATLKSTWSRVSTGNHIKWTFSEATITDIYLDPVVSQDENGYVSITHPTVACDIYYTVDGTTDPVIPAVGANPVAPTLKYNGPFLPPLGTTKVKAKAVSKANYSLTSGVVEYDLLPLSEPSITFDNTSNTVTISSLSGATIYYTFGSTEPADPTVNDAVSHGNSPVAFTISSKTFIKALGVKEGFTPSNIQSLTIDKASAPVADVTSDGKIKLTSSTPGATIYYEIGDDESSVATPTTSSTRYTTPLQDVSGKVIKAIAVKDGWITSDIGGSDGPITLQCAMPVIQRGTGGTFIITCSFPSTGYSIYYTTGNDDPTTLYVGPVSITSYPVTVKAIATADGYKNSSLAEETIPQDLVQDDDYYLIASAGDFDRFVEMANTEGNEGNKYKVTDEFTVGSTSAISREFTGTFDGGFHTISGLSHALFSTINGGTVKNVMLDNVSISGGTTVAEKEATGAIANVAKGSTRIYNCGVLATNSIVTTDENGYTTITSCTSTISGSDYVGGVVGFLDGEARVINCYSYANVSGGTNVGGIVGYNNVATTSSNLKTMVMNCMFYGDITGGTSKAPIYNGENIVNKDATGVSNFNYFLLEAPYMDDRNTTKTYNCALAAEKRYLQRFEFFRHLLNSHRELAGWWATGTYSSSEMAKWVLEPSQIGTSTCYPILKTPGYYPSVVNIDAENAQTSSERNKGAKLGTLSVTIQMGSGGAVFGAPNDADITTSYLTLNITDKDPDHFNFNYYKVQLPYYNEVGTKNYTGNRVVTGWKIVSITGGTQGSYKTGEDATADANGNITATPYNFADRQCTNKDLYSVSGRVFNQGAYWDVPEGVTGITIQPYWGKAVYLADAYADVVYDQDMTTRHNVPNVGGGIRYENRVSTFNDQIVYTSLGGTDNAISSTALYAGTSEATYSARSVYDYAVVLVGNYHNYDDIASGGKPYTITSVDLDGDNEPDYSFILRFDSRKVFHPVRYDFLNLVGLGMAQKSTGGKGTYNLGIMQPKYWFEVTNTALFRVTQFEYDNSARIAAPYIVQGGVIEQWVSGQNNGAANKTTYFHVGGNVWFKEFHRGTHQDKTFQSKHPPISVTGGDYDQFYLTGLYKAVTTYDDNAECYINGGRFGIVAGTGLEGIGGATNHTNGNIIWQIQNADIKEFYGGGINAASPVQGNITTVITGGYIQQFCGGPKFGDMQNGRTVKTTATDCTFGTYFGAGYGGNSYSRQAPYNYNNVININWNQWVKGEIKAHDDAKYNGYQQEYRKETDANYEGGIFEGVSTQIAYQFIPMSGNADNCARLWIEYVMFSLATTYDVTSKLTGCTVTGNFYGGGSLGKVSGPVTSTLNNCTINGSVFGAGFSASLPIVKVMNTGGFADEPKYDDGLGIYLPATFPGTVDYIWKHHDTVNSTETAIDKENKYLYTTEDLNTLGTVNGKVTLTLQGSTNVIGNVYGGGDESAVTGSGHTITVNLQGNTVVNGNVFGGGNEGLVEGSTQVNIE